MSLDALFRDGESDNPDEDETVKQREFPPDRSRAYLSDLDYFFRPPPNQQKAQPTSSISQTTSSVEPDNYAGVRRTIIRRTGMLRYCLGLATTSPNSNASDLRLLRIP